MSNYSPEFTREVKHILENENDPLYNYMSKKFYVDNGEVRAIINEQTGETIDVLEV